MFTLHVHGESVSISGGADAGEKVVKPVTTVGACVSTLLSETTLNINKAALCYFLN